MNKYFIHISLIFLGLSKCLCAQDYKKVDIIVSHYYDSYPSTKILAEQICKDFNSPTERVRAIYDWITKNIDYDTKKYFSKKKRKKKHKSYNSREKKLEKENVYQDQVAQKTLNRKKALCLGYTLLFKDLCDLCNVQCEVIKGGAKTRKYQIGKKPYLAGHAWNAVKIEDKWKLIDATWGAGLVDRKEKIFYSDFSDCYFFTDPNKFFLNHYPRDTYWIPAYKTKDDFINYPLYTRNYIDLNINIDTPNKGIISIGKNDTIHFVSTNLKESDSIEYCFSNEKQLNSIHPELTDNHCEFDIENILSQSGYLTLYVKEEEIVTYKIEVKRY